MDVRDLKKVLAGFCIAGLISGAGLGLTGCKSNGDGGASVEQDQGGSG